MKTQAVLSEWNIPIFEFEVALGKETCKYLLTEEINERWIFTIILWWCEVGRVFM